MDRSTWRFVVAAGVVATTCILAALPAHGGTTETPRQVKVAAVQISGYDKGDVPRPSFDPTEAVVRYIERAAKDGVQLIVFPEYYLGRISVPARRRDRISKAAAGGRIT